MVQRGCLLALTVVVISVAYFAGYTGSIAGGFIVKESCSIHFVSGRHHLDYKHYIGGVLGMVDTQVGDVKLPFLTKAVGMVSGSLFGLPVFQRVAFHTPGLGCTLVPPGWSLEDAVKARLELIGGTELEFSVREPVVAGGVTLKPWEGLNGTEAEAKVSAVGDYLVGAIEATDPFLADNESVQFLATHPDRPADAIVVLKGGNIVVERYSEGRDETTLFRSWSMAKSLTSLMAGTAFATQDLKDTELLKPHFLNPKHASRGVISQDPEDPRFSITLRNLIQASTGLQFDESYTVFGGATQMLFMEEEAAKKGFGQPLVPGTQPGEMWDYSSATTNMLSSVLRHSFSPGPEGMAEYWSTPSLLRDSFGLSGLICEVDSHGVIIGSSYCHMTARDWARSVAAVSSLSVGNATMGVAAKDSHIPSDWISFLLEPASGFKDHQKREYGGQIWLNFDSEDGETQRPWPHLPSDTFAFCGFAGQYAIGIPSRDLVLVRLGWNSDSMTELDVSHMANSILQYL